MEISDHKLKCKNGDFSVSYEDSPNCSGPFTNELPDTIVVHYTAGSSLSSSVNWLTNPQAKASAHLVIGKSGEIVQLVPFNIKAWHAGRSNWKGRQGLNHYSIGIELDNAGMLEKRADGFYTCFGKRIDNSQVVLAPHKNGKEEKAWEAFTEKQIEAVEKICLIMRKKYPITEIVGHDDIAPKRKTDPGPAFPLNSLRDKVLMGRADNDGEDDIQDTTVSAGLVSADYLNIRSEPDGQSPLVSDPLPKGTRLKIKEEKSGWLRVNVILEGWVSKNWVNKV
ncbi:N-acetylmuramoyl-L-alanine amidase [Marinilabilia rubra]|uniref:N-acetylmuramoyl-L-alanine amidase n=1 Tax=Marinilabilia rubra TaxID=2162893 RepID=A0A2U2BAD3_9BACT|nr:N-acetylmuramoyl-L-alanine amidase [Marinilabilia rubra]PWD99992.1 N-acetylmuramoyl-L-alanine amidase [Marinilabilia rubra]